MSHLPEIQTEDLLSFHDYTANATTTIDLSNSKSFTENNTKQSENISFGINVGPEEDKNLDGDVPVTTSFWTLQYYQQFFDIDDKDVLDRIIASILPNKIDFIKNEIRKKPDIYGPFWIAVTLIFTIAISGNVANYLQHANAQYHWKYDFHLVSYAASAIFMYVLLIPFALWGLLRWSIEQNNLDTLEEIINPKLLELICIYGYSLFIYIPVSILWTIQVNWLQWLLVIVGACVSGYVLLLTLMSYLRPSKYKIFLILAIIGCHLLLAAGFMLYFFHVPPTVIVHENFVTSSKDMTTPN